MRYSINGNQDVQNENTDAEDQLFSQEIHGKQKFV